jgi:hypothetical protein
MSDLDNVARRPVLAGIGATAFAAFFNASGAGLCRFAVSSTLNRRSNRSISYAEVTRALGAATSEMCMVGCHTWDHRSGRMGSRADQTDQPTMSWIPRGPTSVRGKGPQRNKSAEISVDVQRHDEVRSPLP